MTVPSSGPFPHQIEMLDDNGLPPIIVHVPLGDFLQFDDSLRSGHFFRSHILLKRRRSKPDEDLVLSHTDEMMTNRHAKTLVESALPGGAEDQGLHPPFVIDELSHDEYTSRR